MHYCHDCIFRNRAVGDSHGILKLTLVIPASSARLSVSSLSTGNSTVRKCPLFTTNGPTKKHSTSRFAAFLGGAVQEPVRGWQAHVDTKMLLHPCSLEPAGRCARPAERAALLPHTSPALYTVQQGCGARKPRRDAQDPAPAPKCARPAD